MTEATLPPGTVLIDRFSLEDLIEFEDGAAVWRARDQTLRRSVAVRTISSDDPRAQALLDAARASAPIVDPRILRVLDTDHDQGVTFSVHEWVSGESLEDLCRDGHLEPGEVAHLMREVADAIGDAHRAGVAHGGLSPGKVLRRPNGEIRIIGFGVDRALHPRSEMTLDPRAADVRDIGSLLFMALTGRPPSPPALASPRRIRAGVPRALDDLCVTLLTRDSLSARQVRDRLDDFLGDRDAHRPSRTRHEDLHPPAGSVSQVAGPPDQAVEPPHWLRLAGIVAAGVLLLIAVAMALSSNLPKAFDPGSGTPSPGQGSPSGTSTPQLLTIASLKDYDPLQSGGKPSENPKMVPFAIDGNPDTAWITKTYFGNPHLGGLKSGVGLLIDLGSQQQVGEVRLTLVGEPTDVSLLAAPGDDVAPKLPDQYQKVAELTGAGTAADLTVADPVSTRYLVVWFTSLPKVKDGYRAGVAELQVYS